MTKSTRMAVGLGLAGLAGFVLWRVLRSDEPAILYEYKPHSGKPAEPALTTLDLTKGLNATTTVGQVQKALIGVGTNLGEVSVLASKAAKGSTGAKRQVEKIQARVRAKG